MDQLTQLRPVTFEWKDSAAQGHSAGTQTGFVAQEVEQVFPKWVEEDANGMKGIVLPPMQLAALQVKAIQELKAKSDAQEKRIQELEDARRPMISFNPNWGIFAAGLVIGGVLLVNKRRNREEDRA